MGAAKGASGNAHLTQSDQLPARWHLAFSGPALAAPTPAFMSIRPRSVRQSVLLRVPAWPTVLSPCHSVCCSCSRGHFPRLLSHLQEVGKPWEVRPRPPADSGLPATTPPWRSPHGGPTSPSRRAVRPVRGPAHHGVQGSPCPRVPPVSLGNAQGRGASPRLWGGEPRLCL